MKLKDNLDRSKKSEKTQFPKVENISGNLKRKETVNGFEKSKKTQFPKMESKGGTVRDKENLDGFGPKYGKNSDEKLKEDGERMGVSVTLKMFRAKCKEISQPKDGISQKINRIDCRARQELMKQGKLWICSSKILGNVPGVKVGDRFEYRVELNIVGRHGRMQHGIDYMEYGSKTLATCVVAKEGYIDKMSDSEEITYMGEGGIVRNKDGDCLTDQKLTRGNLAMKNSMIARTVVRVVRGIKLAAKYGDWRRDSFTYIYDGLYRVVNYEENKGSCGYLVFEFKLKRCPAQLLVPWHKFKNA